MYTIFPMSRRSSIRNAVILTLLTLQTFASVANVLACGPCAANTAAGRTSSLQSAAPSLSRSSEGIGISSAPGERNATASNCGLCTRCLGPFLETNPLTLHPDRQIRQVAVLDIETLNEGSSLSLLKPPQN